MTMRGGDCSQPISGAAVADEGWGFIGRYVTNADPSENPKELRAAEVQDLHDHGIGVLLFGEDGQTDLTSGPDNAVARAQGFIADMQALGVPSGVALVMTDDENTVPDDEAIAAMHACAPHIRAAGYYAGYYGRKSTARALQADGTVQVVVVVDTWGADEPNDRWNFRQLPNAGYAYPGGIECDQDDAPFPEGLWLPAAAPLAPPQVIIETGDPAVPHIVKDTVTLEPDPDGVDTSGYFDYGVDVDTVVAVSINGANAAQVGKYIKFYAVPFEAVAPGITRFQVSSPDKIAGAQVLVRIAITS